MSPNLIVIDHEHVINPAMIIKLVRDYLGPDRAPKSRSLIYLVSSDGSPDFIKVNKPLNEVLSLLRNQGVTIAGNIED